jgi:hypothetical protein
VALVEFNGELSLVLVHDGITELDVQQDLYSDWKEWAVSGNHTQFLEAFRTVGGDPITVDRNLGDSYFITNGWLIQPHSADHELVCTGNLFAEEGAVIFTPATGTVTVTAVVERAIDTFRDTTIVSGSSTGLTPSQEAQLTNIEGRSVTGSLQTDELHKIHGLHTGTPLVVSETQRTAGDIVQDIDDDTPVPDSRTMTRQ